jgi:hypothetical protein
MDETIIGSELESTTSTDTSAEVTAEHDSETAPQEQNTAATDEVEGGTLTDDGGNEAPEFFLPVQFNHEEIKLNQKEAATWAQKGMAYDSLLAPIQRAAALKGMSTKTFVESFEKAQDEAYREELIAKYGEDDMETVESLMELYNQKKESTIKAAEEAEAQKQKEQQTALESRLADEFIRLQKEFPEIEKFEALPKAVVNAAAKGQDLLSAYLLYQHQENKKIEAATKSAENARRASGGSLSTTFEEPSSAMDALMRGLYG